MYCQIRCADPASLFVPSLRLSLKVAEGSEGRVRRTSLAVVDRAAALIFAPALCPRSPARPAPAADAAAHVDARADPAEKLNRKGYAIHQVLDRFLLRPAAMTYFAITLKPLRLGIENVLTNLGEPVVAVNDVLQGRFRKAGATTVRFVTNSTIGVAGIFDVAKHAGIPRHDNGFALTLGRAGVKPGPYLFIPLMGPSTVRDAVRQRGGRGDRPVPLAGAARVGRR